MLYDLSASPQVKRVGGRSPSYLSFMSQKKRTSDKKETRRRKKKKATAALRAP